MHLPTSRVKLDDDHVQSKQLSTATESIPLNLFQVSQKFIVTSTEAMIRKFLLLTLIPGRTRERERWSNKNGIVAGLRVVTSDR